MGQRPLMPPRLLLQAVDAALERIANEIRARPWDAPFAVVGIRRGGAHLAQRLAKLLSARSGSGSAIPCGVVDITLYRDDGYGRRDWPDVGVTTIPFSLPEHTVILVDDVLFTGRTVRAALDAILDYGRPKAVRLAVLVDRGLRELPIAPDHVGLSIDTSRQERVDVLLREDGHLEDGVYVCPLDGV